MDAERALHPMPNDPVPQSILDEIGKSLTKDVKDGLEKYRQDLVYQVELSHKSSSYKNPSQVSNTFYVTLQFIVNQNPSNPKTENSKNISISLKQISNRKIKTKANKK